MMPHPGGDFDVIGGQAATFKRKHPREILPMEVRSPLSWGASQMMKQHTPDLGDLLAMCQQIAGAGTTAQFHTGSELSDVAGAGPGQGKPGEVGLCKRRLVMKKVA